MPAVGILRGATGRAPERGGAWELDAGFASGRAGRGGATAGARAQAAVQSTGHARQGHVTDAGHDESLRHGNNITPTQPAGSPHSEQAPESEAAGEDDSGGVQCRAA